MVIGFSPAVAIPSSSSSILLLIKKLAMEMSDKNREFVNQAKKNLDDSRDSYNQSIINALIENECYEELQELKREYRGRGKKMPGYDPEAKLQPFAKRLTS